MKIEVEIPDGPSCLFTPKKCCPFHFSSSDFDWCRCNYLDRTWPRRDTRLAGKKHPSCPELKQEAKK